MQTIKTLAKVAESPPAQPEKETPTPHTYDCTGCRFVDTHGLVCDVCLRKILDSKKAQPKASLLAACFDGHGMTLLRGRRAVLV